MRWRKRRVADGTITLEFPRTGNAWVDAGIVGLYRVLNRKPGYVEADLSPGSEGEDRQRFPGVVTDDLQADRLVVTGPADQIQACLERAYDRVVATYFNLSSKKQRDDRGSYNFYYDSRADDFVTFPKKKAAGAALLLFDKAARPAGSQIGWGVGQAGKPEPGQLPPSHAHLQPRLDALLQQEGLKPGPTAGLLIDGPNQVRPKVEIRAGVAGARATCFLTGQPEAASVEAKETAFPLLGGSRSFINGNANWPRLGWRADFVGKFVPAVAFFYLQGDDLHLFFPESADLRRVDVMADALARMVDLEPNLFRNFNLELGGYFQGRSEVALGFLHRVFVELGHSRTAKRAERIEAERNTAVEEGFIWDESESSDESSRPESEPLISAEAVFDAADRGGPVNFTVVSASKKGNVWMARDFWTFRDVVYLARLFERMQTPVRRGSGPVRFACSPRAFFRTLIDFEAKAENRTILRDLVCEAILRREPVLHLLERHAFHVNTHTDPKQSRSVWPLLTFARLYEVELRKGTPMAETYEKMVKTATWLGDTIGKAVAEAVRSKDEAESRGRARGALFRLRKTRTTADFMNELARLQFRYDIDVPRDVLDAATLNHETFEEFRGFCVVAALNRFLYATGEPRPRSSATP